MTWTRVSLLHNKSLKPLENCTNPTRNIYTKSYGLGQGYPRETIGNYGTGTVVAVGGSIGDVKSIVCD
ncbi:hypothetical protein VTO42DRAFT_6924 [Malbranchea cinnamomea]